MKKIITLVLCLILTASVFPGCGDREEGGEQTPEEINVNIDKNIEAELDILIPGGNKNEETMLQALISGNGETISFADLFPNVEVNLSYVSVDNYANAVNSQRLAGTLPDIVWSNSPDFYEVVESDTFIDLKPYIRANELQTVCNTYLNGDGEPSKFNYEEDFATNFFDMGSVGEKTYVIPRSRDTVVTFINTDILTKAGVDLNKETTKVKNGWTWDDFMEVCAKVRTYMDTQSDLRNNYVIDANLTAWLSVCYPMLLSYGGTVLDDNGKVSIQSEATEKCLEMVAEMVEKRYINDSTVAVNGSFDNGKSAMLFQSASVSLYADRVALKNKLDLVSFPLIMENNTPKIGAGIAGYAISSKSEKKELAWAFLTFLLSNYGQQQMALNGLNLVSVRKDLEDYKVANWGKDYSYINLSAYVYGGEYKVSTDFFIKASLSAKPGLDMVLKQMFKDASNKQKYSENGQISNAKIKKIIQSAVEEMEYALNPY